MRLPTPPSSHPLADSAAVARERYRESVTAARAGDFSLALAAARRARSAWPAQPAYQALVASMAAAAGDTATAAEALNRLAALGARHPVGRDPAFDGIRSAAVIEAALARMSEQTADFPRSAAAAAIGPADYFAEGVAIGPDGSMYLGSIRHRRVLHRHPDGRESELTPAGAQLWAISGVALAPDGRSLWLTSNAIPQMDGYAPALDGRAELVRIAIDGGRVLERVAVGAETGGAMLGDLVIAVDGGIYASDTRGQVIWHLAPGAGSARVVARHPLLRSPQGLVLATNARGLLVADYSHGLLLVDPATGGVTPLDVPPGITVLGIDGLMRHGRELIAIQNGGVVPRVIRIRLDVAERSVTAIEVIDRNLRVADEPTLGAVVGDALFYVANSQWEKRAEDGTPLPGAALVPTVILRLPLGAISP